MAEEEAGAEAQPTPMDRLEAAFWLLLRSEEVDLPRAKRAARAIVGLMDDDESPAPAAETLSKDDAPQQHAKPGSALHYLASPPAPDAPASKDGRILARLYAICYAALEAAGSSLPEGELEEANGELAPFGWAVERHGDSWAAVPAKEEAERFLKAGAPVLYAMRAPAGGVTVGGVFYAGGKFIPSAALVGQAVMPGGQAVDAASLPGQQQAAQQAYASSAPAASEAVGAVRTLAQSFPAPGAAPPGAASSVTRLLRSAHGHEAPRRLFRLAALLRRAKESLDAKHAPPGDYRSLADSAAVLAEAASALAPSPEAADEARFLIPDDGRLWLLPGVPAGEEEDFEAAGFVRAAPGRWAAPDSEEARSLALERGFRLAVPEGEEAA